MKDSYSFDRDLDGLEESYAKHRDVYIRIFDRCGLETYAVEADVGMMGGHGGEEFVAPSPNGEADLVRCSNCDYAANLEVARSRPRRPEFPAALDAPEEVETPGATTIEGLAEMLGIDPAATAKAMPIVVDGEMVLALVRGDDRLHEMKTRAGARAEPYRPAAADEIREAFGADPGSIGPVGTKVRDDRRRVAPRGPVRRRREPHRLASARRRGGPRLRGRVPRPARGRRRRHVRGLRRRGSCTSSRRSRSGTSSSWVPATPCRSAPPTWTRLERSIPS